MTGQQLLEKAMSQTTLTADTVDAQFCSDWLKDQMRAQFEEIARLREALAYYATGDGVHSFYGAVHEDVSSIFGPGWESRVSGAKARTALAEVKE